MKKKPPRENTPESALKYLKLDVEAIEPSQNGLRRQLYYSSGCQEACYETFHRQDDSS